MMTVGEWFWPAVLLLVLAGAIAAACGRRGPRADDLGAPGRRLRESAASWCSYITDDETTDEPADGPAGPVRGLHRRVDLHDRVLFDPQTGRRLSRRAGTVSSELVRVGPAKRICPRPGCRHPNCSEARFCGRCGDELDITESVDTEDGLRDLYRIWWDSPIRTEKFWHPPAWVKRRPGPEQRSV